ncbi:MAG: 50S ribosomal protein L21 [Propionibacterium sp.]
MYAIVRSGGRQHKVAVGDVVEIDKVSDEVGSSVALEPLLVVDGKEITTDKDALGKVSVTAEILGPSKGPKIHILKYKSKTGYRRHQGHRQHYTRIKVTGINA